MSSRAGYALALLLLCSSAATRAETVIIDDVRLGLQSDGRTRLVLEASSPIPASAEILDGGLHLQITLPGSLLPGDVDLSEFSDGLIRDLARVSDTDDTTQLLVTLTKPVSYSLFPVTAHDEFGYRAVLDLRAAPPPPLAQVITQQPEQETVLPAVVTTEPQRNSETAALTPTTPKKPKKKSEKKSEKKAMHWRDRMRMSGTAELIGASSRADDVQHFTMRVEPRLDIDLSFGRLVAIARARIDTAGKLGPFEQKPANYSAINGPFYNNEHLHASLREFYLDMNWGSTALRLGKQQVVWGQADGIKVLDVVNPQSFREFILDDFDRSRIPLWMVNVEHPFLGGDLQWLYIPDSTTHELADPQTPYAMRAPRWVPVVPEGLAVEINEPDKLGSGVDASDAGFRFRHFLAGWDVSLNYLYHYDDFPVLRQSILSVDGNWLGQLNPDYARSHLVGASASTAFGAFTFRTEIARESDQWYLSRDISANGVMSSPEISAVLGLDWQLGEGLLSVQWFGNTVERYHRSLYRQRTEQMLSLMTQQSFANGLWELRALALYSLDDQDSLFQVRLKHWLASDLELFAGADVFAGTPYGLFGQFTEGDRVLMGLRVGF